MSFKTVSKWRIATPPAERKISEAFSVLEFKAVENRRVKNRDTGEYEDDPNGATWLVVELKFDQKDQWSGNLYKGDLIELDATLYTRNWEKDGVKGWQLTTDFVNSIKVLYESKDRPAGSNSAPEPVAAGTDAPW